MTDKVTIDGYEVWEDNTVMMGDVDLSSLVNKIEIKMRSGEANTLVLRQFVPELDGVFDKRYLIKKMKVELEVEEYFSSLERVKMNQKTVYELLKNLVISDEDHTILKDVNFTFHDWDNMLEDLLNNGAKGDFVAFMNDEDHKDFYQIARQHQRVVPEGIDGVTILSSKDFEPNLFMMTCANNIFFDKETITIIDSSLVVKTSVEMT